MGKIKNLLAVIGTAIALNSCSQPNSENQRNLKAIEEGGTLLRYYFSFEGKDVEMDINERNFIENYCPNPSKEDEEMLIDILYYQFGNSPLPKYNPNLSLEEKWQTLET